MKTRNLTLLGLGIALLTGLGVGLLPATGKEGPGLLYEGKTYRAGDSIRIELPEIAPLVAKLGEVGKDSFTLTDRANLIMMTVGGARGRQDVEREFRTPGRLVLRDGSTIRAYPLMTDTNAELICSLKSRGKTLELKLTAKLSSAWRDRKLPRGLEVCLKEASDPDPATRARAMGELRFHAGQAADRVVPVLAKALEDPEADVRRAAAQLVGAVKASGATLLPRLLELARDDPDESVRAAAAVGLGYLAVERKDEAVPCLVKALEHPHHRVSEGAALGLSMLGAVPELIACMKDKRWWVRSKAIGAFRNKPAEFAAPALESLCEALGDEYWDNRRSAIYVLQSLGAGAQATALPALKRRLDEESDAGLRIDLERAIEKGAKGR